MKKLLFLAMAFLTLSLNAQTTKKVLFVGNSYTYTNNLPQMTADIATSCGDVLSFESSAPGGCTFQQHTTNTTTTGYIQSGGWDYVVLQEQSQYPAFPPSQVASGCFPYAQQLSEMVRQYNPDGEVAFYMTWGRKNGDAQNCSIYPPLCTYEGMDSLLYERYTTMAETNSAIISPVGRVWHVIRDSHPEIELYSGDESHPSAAGTYAAAVTFYTVLFRKSPANASSLSIDAATAQAIRETVQTVVYDSLDFWYRFVADTTSTPNEPDTNAIREPASSLIANLYPNPASSVITLDLTTPGTGDVFIYNELGAKVAYMRLDGKASQQISISSLPDGFYIAEVAANGQTSRQRFVIAR